MFRIFRNLFKEKNEYDFRVVSRLKALVVEEKYNEIIDECCKILESTETEKHDQDLAKSLRGTFYILKKQHEEAMEDFRDLIDDDSTDIKIRANALIKRASLYIQQCKDPKEDPLKGTKHRHFDDNFSRKLTFLIFHSNGRLQESRRA